MVFSLRQAASRSSRSHVPMSNRDISPTTPKMKSSNDGVAREIRKQLLGRPGRGAFRLMPPQRTPIPPQERLRPLPAKYKPLIGHHPAHPGEGKGRGVTKLASG